MCCEEWKRILSGSLKIRKSSYKNIVVLESRLISLLLMPSSFDHKISTHSMFVVLLRPCARAKDVVKFPDRIYLDTFTLKIIKSSGSNKPR